MFLLVLSTVRLGLGTGFGDQKKMVLELTLIVLIQLRIAKK